MADSLALEALSLSESSTCIAIDVECAATGKGHNDRAPCRIAAVDENEETILNVVVKVDDMFSPMTKITGLTREDIAGGVGSRRRIGFTRFHCPPS